MTSDEIADEVVAALNAIDAPLLPFAALKPDDVAVVDAERADLGVFVCPKDESEAPFDQGHTCRRDRVVSVVVNAPITAQQPLSAYLRVVEQLRLALEGSSFDGYLWNGNTTVVLWDREALRRGRFLALFEANYFDLS